MLRMEILDWIMPYISNYLDFENIQRTDLMAYISAINYASTDKSYFTYQPSGNRHVIYQYMFVSAYLKIFEASDDKDSVTSSAIYYMLFNENAHGISYILNFPNIVLLDNPKNRLTKLGLSAIWLNRMSVNVSIRVGFMPYVTEIAERFCAYALRLVNISFDGLPRLKTIGTCFLQRTSIKSFSFDGLENCRTIGELFLDFSDNLEIADFSSPNKVEKIDHQFLYRCRDLRKVYLSGFSNVHYIGNYFMCLVGLADINFNGMLNVQEIGDKFLCNCTNLVTIDLLGLIRLRHIVNQRMLYRDHNDLFLGCKKLAKIKARGYLAEMIQSSEHAAILYDPNAKSK